MDRLSETAPRQLQGLVWRRVRYEGLLDNGKAKMQALVAVMRRPLHAIHGMLEHDHDFDGEKFYATKA